MCLKQTLGHVFLHAQSLGVSSGLAAPPRFAAGKVRGLGARLAERLAGAKGACWNVRRCSNALLGRAGAILSLDCAVRPSEVGRGKRAVSSPSGSTRASMLGRRPLHEESRSCSVGNPNARSHGLFSCLLKLVVCAKCGLDRRRKCACTREARPIRDALHWLVSCNVAAPDARDGTEPTGTRFESASQLRRKAGA